PESLFILLTSDSGRAMLGGVRSVIVDELHALAGNKRGSHLMLSLERLSALTGREPVRIGLSATQKPIEDMARYLMGARKPCAIVDTGYTRQRDIAMEVPRSPLDAVMSNEVWTEIYDKLAELTRQHRTTLVFVNQRRLAERAARHLAERIGEEHVTAHHGSLAKEHRLKAEQRLKSGQLKALVATSALELGIDIGDVDLVCQLGSPRSIAAFLQRVGRAGHAVGAIPKGRLFPLSLDELLEGAALIDAVNRGELDRIRVPAQPLDVLAQQIVAECGSREWRADELYARCTQAAPYRELKREDFDKILAMLADGYATRRGRRGAYLHWDQVNGVLRGRRGARLTALTNAGVIPDQFDYDVVLLPEEHRVGTLNEDFSFESLPGDIFQLGNTSYRIVKIEVGKVYVEDARGQPPTLPFWLGEGLGRSDELSHSVSRLTARAEELIAQDLTACARWLEQEVTLPAAGAQQLTQYLATAHAALDLLPSEKRIVLERFFDEVGDAHLVIHSPYGSRINRAWGLALRKRFCRSFNFELQASALEDSIVLSLGPTHSFPLDDIRHYLKSSSVREVLVQALLDAPMFGTRWRWVASTALALKRNINGKRLPPQFQRSDSEDLLTVVFPDQVACAENLTGERQIPDHPLVVQTIRDCLHEVMDIDGLERVLAGIERGEIEMIGRDLTGPSPLSNAILNAKPYAFLDDGEAEERRTRAVSAQRLHDLDSAASLGRLDPAAIARVREEAAPDFGNADELHDALMVYGFLTTEEVFKSSDPHPDPLPVEEGAKQNASPSGRGRGAAAGEGLAATLARDLVEQRRATQIDGRIWIAAERLHEFLALAPQARLSAPLKPRHEIPDAHDALREIVRSRLELSGPISARELAAPLGVGAQQTEAALLQLEAEGGVMRGAFDGSGDTQWCERRLLARIHRYTRERQRASVSAVTPAQFMRFLLRWHQVEGAGGGDERRQGEAGLYAVLQQLEGCAASASAWERDLLPARVRYYAPDMLDKLCAAGRIAWLRPVSGGATAGGGIDEGGRKGGPIR
ncbi:MAG TPA: helicase-related protein, partial [Nevskiaceae bacterium]|nr:helicase-related protein [Nevskiaceae bacterium]